MKAARWMGHFAVALVCLTGLLLTPKGAAPEASEFQKAPTSCKHVHAILGWSVFKTAEQHQKPWTKVGWILGRRRYIKMVDKPEPGVAQQISFHQYKVKAKDAKGRPIEAHAYVAHCGAGATCNEVAEVLLDIYKGIGKPTVYCGENALPKMLYSPSKPNIPIPTADEIREYDEYEGDVDDDDDENYDFDDDDDDDE